MPYIKQESRDKINKAIDDLVHAVITEDLRSKAGLEGILNYAITKTMLTTYQEMHGEPRYKHINNIIGVLECCKLEMYRRVAAGYEDKAKRNNNDLYEFIKWS